MKRVISVLLVLILTLPLIIVPISAEAKRENAAECIASPLFTFALRAGGGSSGGSSGGGGSSGSSHSSHSNGSSDPLSTLLGFIGFAIFASSSAIAFRFKLSKSARNSKKLMKLLQNKDSAWKYKRMQAQVRNTYFAVQEAWTGMDMTSAKGYMSDELYQDFYSKISWMNYRKQRNVLEHIRLIDAIPVSVHDNEDDSLDFVWFYIKGRMVDYTIDTETNEVLEGSCSAEGFSEYWQFIRNEGDRWVLNRILQNDEADKVPFCE